MADKPSRRSRGIVRGSKKMLFFEMKATPGAINAVLRGVVNKAIQKKDIESFQILQIGASLYLFVLTA